MIIKNGSRSYVVGQEVARAPRYNLYMCTTKDGRECLLQVAASQEFNGSLDCEVYVLKTLKTSADALQEEYARDNPDKFLNYDLGFPEVVDSFVCSEQGNRRINILAFRNVSQVSKMVPISGIVKRDKLRVDLKTSAWIMGKLLKMLSFAHNEGIAVEKVGGDNILIEPDQHYVLIFDWSKAKVYTGEIPAEVRRLEISRAAKTVITVLGGDFQKEEIPDDGEECFAGYREVIFEIANGDFNDALRAHQKFYEFVEKNWKGFYPFTTKRLT